MNFRFAILFVALSLTGKCARAQQPEVQKKTAIGAAYTQDRGLPLGIYFPKHASWDNLRNLGADEKWVPEISLEPHGQYLTFWISRTAGAVKIQATEGLLLPRASRFWHLGSQMVKSDQDPESNYEEQFWALPAGKAPKPPEPDPQIDGRAIRLITYAGPEYVSYMFHWQGGAGAWEYVYPHVASLDDLTKDLSVEHVLGPAASAEYKLLAKSLDHMNDEPKEGEDRQPCNCCTNIEKEWGILNDGDSWQAYARFHYGTSSSCSQGWEDRVLEAAIPKTLGNNGELHRSWAGLRAEAEKVLKGEQGSVRHLFLSPTQDFAVAVGTNGLAVLSVENLHVTSLLKVHPFQAACIPVMEQWSMGRFVGAWDVAVQRERPATLPRTENP